MLRLHTPCLCLCSNVLCFTRVDGGGLPSAARPRRLVLVLLGQGSPLPAFMTAEAMCWLHLT